MGDVIPPKTSPHLQATVLNHRPPGNHMTQKQRKLRRVFSRGLQSVCPDAEMAALAEKKRELRRVQQFAVDITLDPDTAHPNVVLSEDLKQVHHTDVRRELPDSPLRFDRCPPVLGKQSFSSGKFYFEVQVKGKTKWTLGVAQESINRKGKLTLSPLTGFWTIWLRNADEYRALAAPSVRLSPQRPPQKVGVFVDYGAGLVSFYDVDSADLLYSFTGCRFREKLFPYFGPFFNDNGTNSAPLIISAVETNSGETDHSDQ